MQTRRTIRTRDEQKISATVYHAQEENDKIVVFGPSAFATQQLYKTMAADLAQLGITAITFDYRGAGASQFDKLKKKRFTLQQWAHLDLDAVLLYAKNHFPNRELIFIGHGISGELVGLAPASQYINRVVLINAALSCGSMWPFSGRLRLIVSKLLIPFRNLLFRVLPGKSRYSINSLPPGVMKEWSNWCNCNNGLFDLFTDSNYRKMQVALIAFSFTDDWRAPSGAVQALLQHFTGATVTWHHAKPGDYGFLKMGHNGFFEKKSRPVLWNKLVLWFDDRLADEETTSNNNATLPGIQSKQP